MPLLLSVQPVGEILPPLTCTGAPLADGQLATVQAGIAAAAPGDVVCVPAGAWTWPSGLTLTKRIVLKGAGIDQTTITQGLASAPLITWTPQSGGVNRITGFTFITSAVQPPADIRVIEVHGLQKQVRLDHCRIELRKGLCLRFWDGVRGVVDHNIFTFGTYTGPGFDMGWVTQHNSWTGPPATNRFGDLSWASPDSWGTDDAMYFEDNTILFDNTGNVVHHAGTNDGWNGSRVVTRYNTYQNCVISGGHGTDSGGRERGRRQQETYREILNFECAHCGTGGVPGTDNGIIAIGGRAGSYMVWDNRLTATNGSSFIGGAWANMKVFRRDMASPSKPAYQTWGLCGEISITSLTTAGVMTTAGYNGIFSVTVGSPPVNTWVRVTGATGPDAAIYNGFHQVLAVVFTPGTGSNPPSSTVATISLTGTPAADATGTLILTSPYDGNTNSAGYNCIDQIGYGQSDLLTNFYVPTPGWPHQVLTPCLYFLNTANAVRVDPFNSSAPGDIVLNREYITDGSASLIRTGTIEARPLTCNVNDIYWAENDGSWNKRPGGKSGKMYKCLAPNVWTPWYGRNNATGEPLQYPHPLTLL